MSASEPPSGPGTGPPVMSWLTAIGWASGITFCFLCIQTVVAALRPSATPDIVIGAGCQATAYLLGLFLILRLHAPEASIRDVTGLRTTHAAFYPLALLLGASLELPANALFGVIVRKWPLGIEDPASEIFRAASSPKRALIALAIVAVGPLLEELLFRGALFRLLRKTYEAELVILVTAALFTFAHLEWQFFLPIGFVGIALSWLRATSGSIVPSMLFHMTFNGVSFALSAAAQPGAPALDDAMPPRFVALSFVAALALLGAVHLVGERSATAARARELDAR